MGICYLLHIDPPFKHAKHYLGYTEQDDTGLKRLEMHKSGRGSPLIKAAVAAGHDIKLVRTWRDATRTFERQLKNNGHVGPRLCPVCRAKHAA